MGRIEGKKIGRATKIFDIIILLNHRLTQRTRAAKIEKFTYKLRKVG